MTSRRWLLRTRYRFPLLSLALVLALLAPFGLYFALQDGLDILSINFFAIILASLGIAVWAG